MKTSPPQPNDRSAASAACQTSWSRRQFLLTAAVAGAIRPESGFRYAFENGADCICVGMFDFQVEPNVALVRSLLAESSIQNRPRAWMA